MDIMGLITAALKFLGGLIGLKQDADKKQAGIDSQAKVDLTATNGVLQREAQAAAKPTTTGDDLAGGRF